MCNKYSLKALCSQLNTLKSPNIKSNMIFQQNFKRSTKIILWCKLPVNIDLNENETYTAAKQAIDMPEIISTN